MLLQENNTAENSQSAIIAMLNGSDLVFVTSGMGRFVVGIANVIIKPGMIIVDFANVHAVMSNVGMESMGIGIGSGKTRYEDGAPREISSPLLYATIDCAKGVTFSMSGG